jgi:hypothetical protein
MLLILRTKKYLTRVILCSCSTLRYQNLLSLGIPRSERFHANITEQGKSYCGIKEKLVLNTTTHSRFIHIADIYVLDLSATSRTNYTEISADTPYSQLITPSMLQSLSRDRHSQKVMSMS